VHISCWVPKGTNSHSEYITPIFHYNSLHTKTPPCYVLRTLRVLQCLKTISRRVQITILFVAQISFVSQVAIISSTVCYQNSYFWVFKQTPISTSVKYGRYKCYSFKFNSFQLQIFGGKTNISKLNCFKYSGIYFLFVALVPTCLSFATP
jgi:hypothetical protein